MTRLCISAVLLLAATSGGASATMPLRPFTVAESIGMTRLVDPDIRTAHLREPAFKFSPDGRRCAVVLARGNLRTGENEYALLLYDTAEIRSYVNSARLKVLPRQRVLASFATSSGKHAIDEVAWLPDGAHLAFIGRSRDGRGEVYMLDVAARSLQQLTRHATDVVRFAVAWRTRKLVYSAAAKQDWSARKRHGYVVGSETLHDVMTGDDRGDGFDLRYFLANLDGGPVTELPMTPGMRLRPQPLVASPDGRWTVVATEVPRIPVDWRRYPDIQSALTRLASVRPPISAVPDDAESPFLDDEPFRGDVFGGGRFHGIYQFRLIDLTTATVRTLVDAPARRPPAAVWSPDGRHVLIARTHLPLDALARDDQRGPALALAVVDVTSGRLDRVDDLPEAKGARGRIARMDWLADGSIAIQYAAAPTTTPHLRARYVRVEGRWTAEPRQGTSTTRRRETLTLRIVQDMNTPPEIEALDGVTGRRRRITDLNPQLRALALGRVETFEWTEAHGATYVGGIVYPPRYAADTRYPLVIQTYGFSAAEFLVDGPHGAPTAYAARALANRNILVLQIPEIAARDFDGTLDEDNENARFTRVVEGAIDALDARGLIDRSRVGLIGWSRAGMHVQHAVTFSNYPIAAATVADSAAATPFCYAALFGFPYAMLDYETPRQPLVGIGAPLLGAGVTRWIERSPIFHVARIRTPTRYEHLGVSYVPCHWDMFALQRHYGRPVELIAIPDATHDVQQPHARYTSQQGNVDWFVFWLNGEEDSDPAKVDQYRRWRELRRLHEAHVASMAAPESETSRRSQ